MARGQSASFNANVNLNVVTTGESEILRLNKLLSDVGTTIKTISNGSDLQNYWISQEQLVERLSKAVRRFHKFSTEGNAEELIKTANALKAMDGDAFTNAAASIKGFNTALHDAIQMAPTIDAAFSADMFKGAFDSFERLKSEGVNVESIFNRLSSSETFETLNGEVQRLTEQLAILRNENDNLKSASGLADMRLELEEAIYDAESAREKVENLFSTMMRSNSIDIIDSSIIDRLISALDRLESVIAGIANGTYAFDSISAGAENTTESISSITAALQESASGGESARTSIEGVLAALAEINSINADKLKEINSSLRAIGNLNQLKVSASSIGNITSLFTSLDSIKNPSNIALLSTIDFSRFQELKVSKTSLSNIATQLGAISALDTTNLQVVSALNFDNFAKLEVNTKAINSLSRLAERLTEASKRMSEIQLIVKGMTGGLFDQWAAELETAGQRTRKAAEDAEIAKTQIDEVVVGQRQAIANAINTATSHNMVGDADVDRQIGKLHEYDAALEGLDRTSKDYESTKNSIIKQSNEVIKALNQEVRATKMVEAAQRADNKTVKESEVQERKRINALASISKSQSKASDYLKQYTAAEKSNNASSVEAYERIRSLVPQYESLHRELDSGRITEEEATAARRRYNAELESSVSIIKQNGDAHLSMKDAFAELASNVSKVMGVANTIRMVSMYAKMLIKTTIELNDAFTQLRIVTGASDAQMADFVSTSTSLAGSLGRSVSEVTGSIETFSRLGYALEEASELARYASILSNVAAVDTGSATTGLTSIIKGYNMDVSDAEHVADVLVEIGQKYAISAQELMEAFELSGAALSSTNVSFEKSAALLAAANASVQNASTVGTALKTVSARIRKSVSELEEMGEDTSDLADGFSKYADEVKALTNVDIMLDKEAGVFRDLYDIFNDIAKVWDTLSDTQQARISEIFGGTRQLQVISSIIGNWEDAESALETATESAGAAVKANDIFMESSTAHINQLKAAWQKLAYDLVDSKAINFVIDSGKIIIKLVDGIIVGVGSIVDGVGGLAPALTLAASAFAFVALSADPFLAILSAIGGAAIFTAQQIEINNRKIEENIKENAKAAKEYNSTVSKLDDLEEQYKNGKISVDEFKNSASELLSTLGFTDNEIEKLTDDVSSLVEETKKATIEQRRLNSEYIRENLILAQRGLNKFSQSSVGLGDTRSMSSTDSDAIRTLTDAGYSFRTYVGQHSDTLAFKTDFDTTSIDGLKNAYSELNDMILILSRNGLANTDVYISLVERAREYKDAIEDIDAKTAEYNNSVVSLTEETFRLERRIPYTSNEFQKYRAELVGAVESTGNFEGSTQDAINAVNSYLKTLPEFQKFYSELSDSGEEVAEQTKNISEYFAELSSKIEDRSKLTSVLESAQKEMYSTSAAYTNMGGLSLDTIQSMMQATEDWIDYLYVENGVLMLDIDAWQQLANSEITQFFDERRAAIEAEAAAILTEIDNLKRRNAEIDNALRTTLPFTDAYRELTEEQKRNSEQIKEYTDQYATQIERQLELQDALQNAITGGTDPYSQALANVENVATRITSVGNSLSKLASIQQEVANGFTMSLDKAMEFASVYPQILDNATLSADGQIQLNEDVVNSLIEGEEASLRASIESDIAQLQAKNELAKSKLELAKAEYDAIGQMDIQSARSMLDTNKKYVEALIASGKSETEAYRIVANALSTYMAQGGQSAANALSNYTEFMVATMGDIIDAAHQAAAAVSGIGAGIAKGSKVKTGGGKASTGNTIQSLQQRLAGGIGALQSEIASNEGQIAALQALLNTTLPEFRSSFGGASSGGGGGGGSSSSSSQNKTVAAANEWFNRLLTYHKHMVASEKETDADYFKWLAKAYKEAYQQGEITLEEYWRYEEEVANGIKKIAEDAKNAFNNILKETQSMIKQDLQNQRDNLNDKLDALKDYYQKQKDMLKDVADEEKYLREQSEKRKAVIDIQDQLDQLAYDDSAWAQKRRLELQEQLSDVSQDLDDFEKEHALNAALDEIDNAYNAQAQAIQKQIDAIDEILNDPRALHNLALKEIVENTGGLYKALLEYNRKYGDGEDSTVKELWEEWYKADSEYRKTGNSSYNNVTPTNATGATIPTAPSTQNTVAYVDKLYGTSLATGSTIRVKSSATNFGEGGSGAPLPKGVAGGSYTVYGVSSDGNEVLIGRNGVYTGWIKRSDIQGYRYGTSNATPGFHRVNEGGMEELVFSSKDGNSYRMLNGGDKVLNGKATNFLYNFANAGAKLFSSITPNTSFGNIMRGGVVNNITMSPITITGSADEKTVSELRRAQRAALDETLKAFNRLNK